MTTKSHMRRAGGVWSALFWSMVGLGGVATMTLSAVGQQMLMALGIWLQTILITVVEWVFNPTNWGNFAVGFGATFCAAVFSILPSTMQTAVGDAITYVTNSQLLEVIWKLAWYCIGIFCNTSILIAAILVYITTYAVALVIRLCLTVYNLIPTRG